MQKTIYSPSDEMGINPRILPAALKKECASLMNSANFVWLLLNLMILGAYSYANKLLDASSDLVFAATRSSESANSS
jgi:hypothetical protein